MKKWILGTTIAVVIIIGVFAKVYYTARAPVKAAESKAVALAKKHGKLTRVTDFQLYHGSETIDVVQGKNKKEESMIVWFAEKSKAVVVKKASSGISKKEAIQKLEQEAQPKKIISVKLGMENGVPLWEIYYLTDHNLINYYYLDFQTGDWLKKIENL